MTKYTKRVIIIIIEKYKGGIIMKKKIISLILMGITFSLLPSTGVFADNNLGSSISSE